MQPRLAAARVLQRVREGESLSRALPALLEKTPQESHATIQALSYGVLRYCELIEAVLAILLNKPLKRRDRIVADLLRVALFELLDEASPDYAIVDNAVRLVRQQRTWAAGLGNAVLRRFLRERDALLEQAMAQPSARWLLPDWLAGKLRKAWPDQFEQVSAAMAQPPPLTLRVDLARVSRQNYLHQLQEAGISAAEHPVVASAVVLETACDITQLPGFTSGIVSVQDAAAQLAANLLEPKAGERILDACAAPGGKTIHILERVGGEAKVVAVESDPARVGRLRENLDRSGYSAQLVPSDAAMPAQWWDGNRFDRILLDAPCSATGVIRRHPDIKRHRRPEDVVDLARQQRRLLQALWPLLKPGGTLLYATCSVLPEENERQIGAFVVDQEDCTAVALDVSWGHATGNGNQILPGEHGMDGFFYARLRRSI